MTGLDIMHGWQQRQQQHEHQQNPKWIFSPPQKIHFNLMKMRELWCVSFSWFLYANISGLFNYRYFVNEIDNNKIKSFFFKKKKSVKNKNVKKIIFI